MSVVAVGRYLLMSKYLFLSSHKNAFALQTDDLYLQWQIFDIHKGNSPFLPQLILFGFQDPRGSAARRAIMEMSAGYLPLINLMHT